MAIIDPAAAADRMTKPRPFGRPDLVIALGESFGGAGPDSYSVGPLKRIRFMTQIVRKSVDGRTILDAAIPAPSGRGMINRRDLVTRGWSKPGGPGTRYYRRRFVDADEAFAGIISAYEGVYGIVGDDRGWTIREVFRPNEPAWDAARWIGQEANVVGRSMRPATATIGLEGDQPRRLRRIASSALVGVFCSWATIQSSGHETGLPMAPALIVAILAAEIASAVAVGLTDAPHKLANASAAFWGGGALARAVVAGSVCACASIASGMALVLLLR